MSVRLVTLAAALLLGLQAQAGSGYAYDNRQVPVSYVHYTSHAALPYELPVSSYGDYAEEPLAPYYLETYLQPPPVIVVHPEEGHQYEEEDHSAQGEREERGQHEFERGEREQHEAEQREGDFYDEAGHRGGHEHEQSRYDAHERADAARDGADFGNKSYQKKGVRTSGFHNVYHKDEYKKDTDFYDEDHEGGHFEKYGAHDAHHQDEAAAREQAGSHAAGFEQDQQARSGHYDQGRAVHDRQGHEGAEGEDSYRQGHADYASKGGHRV